MSLRPLKMPPGVPGQLWLSSMPGRFEGWANFEQRAQWAGLTAVVCLTPRTEMLELSPAYYAAVMAGRVSFRWTHLPIRNFGVPDDPAAFRREINDIARMVRAGDAVLLHCAAGIGRTGSAAACVLKSLGVGRAEALDLVRDAGSNPQNAAQSGIVDWF